MLKAQLAAGATDQINHQPIAQNNDQLLMRLQQVESEKNEYAEDLEKLRKDQEDLLELLTDQDVKLDKFKLKLKQLGESLDEDDSDTHSVDVSDNEINEK